MAARQFSNVAVETTLSSGIAGGASSLTVVSATGWPAAPFILVIEPDLANEELILVGAKAGAVFSSLTRGFGGTSDVGHSAGDDIKHVMVGEDLALTYTHVHKPGTDDTAAVTHADILSLDADDHHTEVHTVESTGPHAQSGLAAGEVLKASGAAAFDFGVLAHTDLDTVGVDDHHTEDHAARHADGGADELDGDDLASGAAVVDSVLTADGAGAATWEDRTGYRFSQTIKFTGSGSFTKATYPGLRMVVIHAVGSGGGGGGVGSTISTEVRAGAGGGGGGYGRSQVLASALSASETVTVGAGGAGGVGNADGADGNDSSVGAHASGRAGERGRLGVAIGVGKVQPGATPGEGLDGSTGDVIRRGGSGDSGLASGVSDRFQGGQGGTSGFGGGGGRGASVSTAATNGAVGGEFGGGGGGAGARQSQSAQNGGAGGAGIVLIDLYH